MNLIPMPFWKSDAPFGTDGLKILLDMTNFQAVLDGGIGTNVDWVDQDLSDGQTNSNPMAAGGGVSGVTIVSGEAVGGWDDVLLGNPLAVQGPVVLTPVGAREFTLEQSFEVAGTTGDDVQMWLFVVQFSGGFQMVARVRYLTGTNQFRLYMAFNADTLTVDISPATPYVLTVDVYDDAGVMKADFSLNAALQATLNSSVPLDEITGIGTTFPFLTNTTPTGAGLTFKYGGFALETTP